MIAANFRKHPEAKAAQLCFDFYMAFELLCQIPNKLQQQAIALGEWARSKTKKEEEKKPAERRKASITSRLLIWIKNLFKH